MKHKIYSICLVICLYTYDVEAGWKDVVAYTEALLTNGRTVAFLVIDMQQDYLLSFAPEESTEIIVAQNRLLEHFTGREGIYFVDVHYANRGAQSFP